MSKVERARFRRKVREARRRGLDLWEHLNYHHMLLTPQRYHQVRGDVLRELADDLEKASISEIIAWYGSGSNTALDAQRGIVALIRGRAQRESP